jgi:alkyl sulfatase BDS1-like metallo-beta-lactamase superfamily hydrolase
VPSHLKPAPLKKQAHEIAEMAGGVANIVARALTKFEAQELALASHLIDWAALAAPDDKDVHQARVKIYAARAAESKATMSHGVFRAAATESAAKAGVGPPENQRRF